MKYLRLLPIVAMLTISVSVFGKTEWEKTTVKYKGETYIIQYTENSYSIQNKKYVMPKGTETTIVVPHGGIEYDDFIERMGAVSGRINDIVYSVFPEEVWPVLRKAHIMYPSFFDVKTSDYIGGYIRFNIRVKDIVTIDKVYEIERKLEAAHLNVGKLQFTKPNKKYFAL